MKIKLTRLQKFRLFPSYPFNKTQSVAPTMPAVSELTKKAAGAFTRNRFCQFFRCDYPLVLAPMGGIAGANLAAAVANAGGIGFVGTGGQNPHASIHFVGVGDMVGKLARARHLAAPEHIGLGLTIEGCLDKDAPVLDQVLSQSPRNLWLSCISDGKNNFGPFVRLARSTRIPVKLFCQVKDADEAKIAAITGAHAIVLQGK